MTLAALIILACIVAALIVRDFLASRERAQERRELIAAVLSSSPTEYRLLAADPHEMPQPTAGHPAPEEQVGI